MEKKRSESRLVRLTDFEPVLPDVLNSLPAGVIRRQMVIPIGRGNGRLVVATTPKQEGNVKPEGLQLLAKCPVDLVYAPDADVRAFIDRHYPDPENVLNPVVVPIPEAPPASKKSKSDIPAALHAIVIGALTNSASQVLISTRNGSVSVRQRIRGVLITDMKSTLTREDARLIFDHISKVGDSRGDGSVRASETFFEIVVEDRVVGCRVVLSDTTEFQLLTLYLHNNDDKGVSPTSLGMGPNQVRLLERWFTRSQGLVIFCGHDNDDVDSTLRACVRDVASPERQIVAVEKFRHAWFPGVEPLAGAKDKAAYHQLLETAFRHTPDVLVVNPLECASDAELCLAEALKGRFVLARMYAVDATDAVGRLLNMGVEPYLVGSGLAGVVAQRTLRLICQNCQEKELVSRDRLKEWGIPIAMQPSSFFKGKGCAACFRTGFDRESNIFEVLDISDEVRSQLTRGVRAEIFRNAIKADGMMTLRQVALHKAINGQTSLSEVFRVTP